MKIFNSVFMFLFFVSAALQFNDPDPILWILIYSFGAFICYSSLRQWAYPRLILYSVFVFAIYATYLFFDKNGVLTWISKHQAENIAESMKASSPWIEETREFFGLMILIFVFLINYFHATRLRANG